MKLINLKKNLFIAVIFLISLTLHGSNITFISSNATQAGKFVHLLKTAKENNVSMNTYFIEDLPHDSDEQIFVKSDIIVFDILKDHNYIEESIRKKIPKAIDFLETKNLPILWLNRQHGYKSNLDEKIQQKLYKYYTNGGSSNNTNFFKAIKNIKSSEMIASLAEPIIYPESGIYHPKAKDIVFENSEDYLKFIQYDIKDQKPVIAITFSQQYLISQQTALIDDFIAEIEKNNAIALAFYCKTKNPKAIRDMVTLNGENLANVLINNQPMFNSEGRKKEFESLEIPVLQALYYRKGDEKAWKNDPHGIDFTTIPYYLAQQEYAGVTDIQIVAAISKDDDQIVSIKPQLQALVQKAFNLTKLQTMENKDKKISLFFYNYPPGEKNLTASFLNVPKSLEKTLQILKEKGYTVDTYEQKRLTALMQNLLSPFYRQNAISKLQEENLVALLPLKTYLLWLDTLPIEVKNELNKHENVYDNPMLIQKNGKYYFAIPRLQIGNLSILPQPPKDISYTDDAKEKEKKLYHNTKHPPSHHYFATYLWAVKNNVDALIHYGTHGTQEWLSGKERGLSSFDYPMLAVGDIPVIYPYIVDNIGEALQAKRRGRATVISHQTPTFTPTGLHTTLTLLHDNLHTWLNQSEGLVKEKIKLSIISNVQKENIDKNMGYTEESMKKDFPTFIEKLHNYLHELAGTLQPLGLHSFGVNKENELRIFNVLSMLNENKSQLITTKNIEADELFVIDYKDMNKTEPYKILSNYIANDEMLDMNASQKEILKTAKEYYNFLEASVENQALIDGLNGKYIFTSYGGDPIRNPSSLPTGKNLYGFDPSRIPTKESWEAGKVALDNLLQEHEKSKDALPKKLTFTLWSTETMRHFGILEAQAMFAMGVEPIWDTRGKVTGVKLIPKEKLQRERIDVVLSISGLYRDTFPNIMKHLAMAVKIVSETDESGNNVAINTKALKEKFILSGMSKKEADNFAKTRMFTSESGQYGTGLGDATLATDTWKTQKDGDAKMAQLYLSKMQFAYGPDESTWGSSGKNINLYAEQLKGTDGVVFARTSNLYGMITSDDPFQYFGGISLAVKHLDGNAPELYIANLRNKKGKIEKAETFLSKELSSRYFHPGYIEGLKKEGYAGTLEVLKGVNNFWGWTAVAKEIVRDDQWNEFADVYVNDKYKLGLNEWFEKNNPDAQAQSIERMMEAARKKYWNADEKTLQKLAKRYNELAKKHDIQSNNKLFKEYMNNKASAHGYGLNVAKIQANKQNSNETPPSNQTIQQNTQIKGMKLEEVVNNKKVNTSYTQAIGIGAIVLSLIGGLISGL